MNYDVLKIECYEIKNATALTAGVPHIHSLNHRRNSATSSDDTFEKIKVENNDDLQK